MTEQAESKVIQEDWVMFLLEHFDYREYTFSEEDIAFQKEYILNPSAIKITGSLPISLVEKQIGNLPLHDMESLRWDFADYKKVKEFFTHYLYDIIPQRYHTFSYVDIDLKKKKSSLHVSVQPYFG